MSKPRNPAELPDVSGLYHQARYGKLWDWQIQEQFDRAGETLRDLVDADPKDSDAHIALATYEGYRAELERERAEQLPLARTWRAILIAALSLLVFWILPKTMFTPTCEMSARTNITALVGLGWAIALWWVPALLWVTVTGSTARARAILMTVYAFLRNQYRQTPTLAIILWSLIMWLTYNTFFRYAYDWQPAGYDGSDTLVVVTDHVSGNTRRQVYTSDQCFEEDQANRAY